MNRRDFLRVSSGAAAFLAAARHAFSSAVSPRLTKWSQAIRQVTDIPISAAKRDPVFGNLVDFHEVEIVEFTDQLHPASGFGPTRLWGYKPVNPLIPPPLYPLGVTGRHLGGIIVAERNKPVRLRATNKLPADHILPVDDTIPGADMGHNRTAIHLHGGAVQWISDGGPFDWFGPSHGPSFMNHVIPGAPPKSNKAKADYIYPNRQSARMVWYHDHAYGITRLNAYAGIASGYLITDQTERNAFGTSFPSYLGIPIVFQDKTFVDQLTIGRADLDPSWSAVARWDVQSTGSLWYEHVYEGLSSPNPSCVPEFFGDTMLVNGTVYPVLTLKPGTHRLRILNACNARFLNLNLFKAALDNPDGINLNLGTQFPSNAPGPVMKMVASEGGWLHKPVNFTSPVKCNPLLRQGNLILAPAERADVLITIPAGYNGDYILYNDAPAPFPNGELAADYYLGGPNPVQPAPGTGPDTRQLLRIKVSSTDGVAGYPSTSMPNLNILSPDPPLPVRPPSNPVAPLGPLRIPTSVNLKRVNVRDLTLNEAEDIYGRLIQMIGTLAPQPGGGFGQPYENPATEVVRDRSWEVWRIYNLSADTHPMHFHLANVQVLQRQPYVVSVYGVPSPNGPARGPELEELCWKETVKCPPGECTTVIMEFNLPGFIMPFLVPNSPRTGGHEFVWHCHILEHEEHDMMRPLVVI